MTAERLKEIAERATDASDGPWVEQRDPCKCGSCPYGAVWKEFGTDEQETVCREVQYGTDAEFIAHSRTDIPELLAHIQALEEANAKLQWVEVSPETMPGNTQPVLIVVRGNTEAGTFYTDSDGDLFRLDRTDSYDMPIDYTVYEVSHWMLMPHPPARAALSPAPATTEKI